MAAHPVPSEAEVAPTGPGPVVRDILQGLLVFGVVAWVLDLPRQLFGLAFYTEQFLAMVLGLSLGIAYIGGRRTTLLDWAAGVTGLLLCAYIAVRYPDLSNELAMLPWDGIIGSAILIVLVLDATRRAAGPVIVTIVLVMIAYVFVGPHMPAEFQTRPVSPWRLVVYLGLDINGMIGSILSVAAIIVIPFTLMGQILARTGGSEFFADLAMSGMGRFRGGAAKIAVVGSALFGMISGAAVSNVMAVGIVTIPLMMRSGFSPTRSGAIEAVGSTGGQLMPPVMGAAAFIMAELLQVPYAAVVVAAVLPSLLYYGTLFLCVDLEAAKGRIGAAPVENAPRFFEILKSGWHFLIPIAFLVLGLLYLGMPAERAAIYSAGILIVLNFVFGYRGHRVSVREMIRAIVGAGRASLDIILIGAAAGLVVGVLNISGLAFGLTLQLITISGQNVAVLLLLTAIVSFVLGMGMPTVGVYVLTATLVAPALVQLGVKPMAAHMFVMYYGMLSMITPPVALASYAAANIARTSGWGTSWQSVAFGWSAFILPFLFVGSPSLLFDAPLHVVAWDFSRTGLGIYAGCVAVIGYSFGRLGMLGRLLYGTLSLLVLVPHFFRTGVLEESLPAALCIAVLAADYMRRRGSRAAAAEA